MNDESEKLERIVRFIRIFCSIALVLFCGRLLYIMAFAPSAAEDTAEESVSVEETVDEEAVDVTVEEVTEPLAPFSRIALDSEYEIVIIGGVGYIVYDAGYGSSAHSSMTLMVDANGEPMTEAQIRELY